MKDDYLPLYSIDLFELQLKEYFRKEGNLFDPVHAYAGKDNLFSIKLHHGGKFTPFPKRMYVRGKVNYVDNINADMFNICDLHMFISDLGYEPMQLMFYHYKLPEKSLDYGLKPLSCDDDVVNLIKLVENCKEVEVFVEYWLSSVDHKLLSPFKSTVEIEEIYELDAASLLNAPVKRVGSSKKLVLCWIDEVVDIECPVGSSKSLGGENLNANEPLDFNARFRINHHKGILVEYKI